jgi:hypothetical protein
MPSESILVSWVLASVLLLSVVAAMPYRGSPNDEDIEQQALASDFDLKEPSSSASTRTWLRYLLSQSKQQEDLTPHKRFSEFSVPYLKYRHDKRNDGIWIWMPAQGYVSVPKQQQTIEDPLNGKPGKIMRYGK